jgi:hypothetical protein
MDDPQVAASPQYAPALIQQPLGAFGVKDIEEHRVVNARCGKASAFGNEVSLVDLHILQAFRLCLASGHDNHVRFDVKGMNAAADDSGRRKSERSRAVSHMPAGNIAVAGLHADPLFRVLA